MASVRPAASWHMTRCQCAKLTELAGTEAAQYVEHLRRVSLSNETWEAEYSCPETGWRWLEAYPDSGAHGGGSPRLWRMDVMPRRCRGGRLRPRDRAADEPSEDRAALGRWEGGQEVIWGLPTDGGYAVDNIPLFAYGLSLGDTIQASEREGVLTYAGVVRRGGHSTYRVAFPSFASEDQRRTELDALRAIGCGFERGPSRMVAIDVPPATEINQVYAVLERGMADGRWTFEEAHCGHPLPRKDSRYGLAR